VHVGTAWSGFANLDTFPPNANCWWCVAQYGDESSGFMGGATLGYNLMLGQAVVGVEGEFSGLSVYGHANDPIFVTPETRIDTKYSGAITARGGIAFDRLMAYGKVGWGAVRSNIDWADNLFAATAHAGVTASGLVYGGGVEYALTDSISAKIEYLRFDVDRTKILDIQGFCCGFQQMVRLDSVDTVKFGLNLRFGQ
jgi:outer membrane immunogenic protein